MNSVIPAGAAGLSEAEARDRLKRDGPNRLPPPNYQQSTKQSTGGSYTVWHDPVQEAGWQTFDYPNRIRSGFQNVRLKSQKSQMECGFLLKFDYIVLLYFDINKTTRDN